MARRSTKKQRQLEAEAARLQALEASPAITPEMVGEPTIDDVRLTGAWKLLGWIGAFVATAVAQKGISALWRSATGRKPPSNPADPGVQLSEAITWAASSAAISALAKMLATRRATRYYLRSTAPEDQQI